MQKARALHGTPDIAVNDEREMDAAVTSTSRLTAAATACSSAASSS